MSDELIFQETCCCLSLEFGWEANRMQSNTLCQHRVILKLYLICMLFLFSCRKICSYFIKETTFSLEKWNSFATLIWQDPRTHLSFSLISDLLSRRGLHERLRGLVYSLWLGLNWQQRHQVYQIPFWVSRSSWKRHLRDHAVHVR